MPDRTHDAVLGARDEAERKAWDGMARYKFDRFGYWSARWVGLNQLLPKEDRRPNPWRELVHAARAHGHGPGSKIPASL